MRDNNKVCNVRASLSSPLGKALMEALAIIEDDPRIDDYQLAFRALGGALEKSDPALKKCWLTISRTIEQRHAELIDSMLDRYGPK